MLETPFPSFISKKPSEIPIFGTFFGENSILPHISLKIGFFRSAMFGKRHCDVIRWPIFKILVSMERETLPYTMVSHTHTLGMSISSS